MLAIKRHSLVARNPIAARQSKYVIDLVGPGQAVAGKMALPVTDGAQVRSAGRFAEGRGGGSQDAAEHKMVLSIMYRPALEQRRGLSRQSKDRLPPSGMAAATGWRPA